MNRLAPKETCLLEAEDLTENPPCHQVVVPALFPRFFETIKYPSNHADKAGLVKTNVINVDQKHLIC